MKTLLAMPLIFARFLLQSIWLAVCQIWSNKMRSVLTVIGIVIGVAAVISVIAVLSGLKAKVLADLEIFGTNTIYIDPQWPKTGPKKHASMTIIRFSPNLFEGIKENCPSVKRSGLTCLVGQPKARYGNKLVDSVLLQGVEPDFHAIDTGKSKTLLGRTFTPIDEMPVCRIGVELRDKLNLPKECIGENITVGTRQFRIIGIIEKRPELSMLGGNGGQESWPVYIPFRMGLKINTNAWIWGLAEAKSTELTEEAQAEIEFFLRKARHLKPGEPDTFIAGSVKSYIDKFSEISFMITLVAGSVVSISLIVGGVGIMNIMLVSVSERTREIGLRKAVGAKRSAILMQFLIEAIVLCLLGGLLGILLGEAITKVFVQAIPQLNKTYIPGWAIAMSFGFAAIVGVCFGFFPAVKAARLDPIEALRHE